MQNRIQNSSHETEILRETSYNVTDLNTYINDNILKLINDQKAPFEKITDIIQKYKGGLTFLDTPGGIGKLFY